MEEKDQAFHKLEDLSVADCAAAVAADVDSKRDEFRSIDSHELASLLGIDDADKPGGDWSRSWYILREPVDDILAFREQETILELLKSALTRERYEDLRSKIDLLEEGDTELLKFLTDDEKADIEGYDMDQRAAKEGADFAVCYAYKSVEAPDGKDLRFQALIEDDGACIELKTPYDERDGEFFSDGLEVDFS